MLLILIVVLGNLIGIALTFISKQIALKPMKIKKALFLWSVGDTTYNLLESLISPRLLTDDDTKFIDVIKLLDVHYDAKRNIMTATYDFYSCYQKSGQPFAEWKVELCEKLRHCAFTTSALHRRPQDCALRDMYVIGTNSNKVRQALLKEQDPDLETTEKIIQLAERLEEDVRHFAAPNNHNDYSVAKLHNHQRQQKQPDHHLFKKDSYKACETGGSNKHFRSKCKYREFICNFCKRSGHLERVCRQRNKKQNSTKHITTIFKLNNLDRIEQLNNYSCTVPLKVNGHDIHFELDTGTFNAIISIEDWYKLGSPTIHPSKLQLKCYSRTRIKIKGECYVEVQYQNKHYKLLMIIVNDKSEPLLGLKWIHILQLDVNSLLHIRISIEHHINKVYDVSKLHLTLKNDENMLNNKLGHCTKVQAHIQLKSDAIPKIFKPRPIPFAYLTGVKEEIERNVNAGILERIDTSPWTAPIVPIKKPNSKIRICGDFKVTINSQILVDQHPIPSIDELLSRLNNGEKFTKLDLSDAYLQVELDEQSKSLVVINTPLGLFRYNRMPFVIAGISNSIAYLDDILITGKNEEEHIETLELVLKRLSEFGFTCNQDKYLFFQDEVSYLGFIIDNKCGNFGFHPRVMCTAKSAWDM
ncbi:unnamed protein product [Rotaria magnacalcarata]|uniref:Reverse transcriptase domain-containing protein n=1 Tax=Rotaria magnacalcarata TaxID=392030 RepID=A0A820P9V8_9BILA|nr:unnamed protein product [Rotaria magnacalcarata]